MSRTMYYNSIYSQLFNFIPRYRFEKIVKKSGAVVKTFETGPMRPLSKVFFSTLFINSYLQGLLASTSS